MAAISKTPMGPFQTMVRARATSSEKASIGLRADVEGHHVGWDRFAVADNLVEGAGFTRSAMT